MNILKERRGQVMVEFALVLIIFMLFIWGLIGVTLWGTAGFLAQEVAHESAREYAVTLDEARAENLGKTYLGRWGYLFIKPGSIQVSVDANTASNYTTAVVTVKPRVEKMYIFTMPYIERTSQATLEHFYRDSGRDDYVW